MTIVELLQFLRDHNIGVSLNGDGLALKGEQSVLQRDGVLDSLRAHKQALVEHLRNGESLDAERLQVPANLIPTGCTAITPQMLTLVELSPVEIEHVTAQVPGGAANVQDIYPLVSLQEGMLYHHLRAEEGDPYLSQLLVAFTERERLERYLEALGQVIERHDILRTGFVWDGLREPVQVVWRQARLAVEELHLDPQAGEAQAQLKQRFDPHRYRLDVAQAPLLRCVVTWDAHNRRWLLLTLLHHLIGDHLMQEQMQREVNLLLAGRGIELGAAPAFRTLVAHARLGVSTAQHEAFFKAMLADIDEPTLAYGVADVQGSEAPLAHAQRMLPAALDARLRAQSRRLGVSVAVLCHVAWAQVIARTSGREQVVFGTVLLGRSQGSEAAEQVMGMAINTLPVRLDMDDTGAEAAVRHMHLRLAQMLRHEHAPLVLAQRCSGVGAGVPLFNALLNYRHSSPEAASTAVDPVSGMQWVAGEERTNYPIILSVDDLGEALSLSVQVVPCLPAERLCDYMECALDSLAQALEQAPGLALHRLQVVPEQERALLQGWNRTAAAYPAQACIHQLFERQVQRTPEAVAVVSESQRLSYAQLNARANRLARHLREHGVGPDARVAVCLERSTDMLVALLATLKAGGAYVPLDPGYPTQRLVYMLEDSAPQVVLTHPAASAALAVALSDASACPVLDLERDADAWAGQSDDDLPVARLTSRHLAYVIYTSGSTGQPKGVANEHAAVLNRLWWMLDAYGLTAADRVLQKTPFSFDVSVPEFFCPLFIGACVVMARPEGHKDQAYLGEVIEAEQITQVHFVPSMLDVFLAHGDVSRCASLKRVMCSGEALPGSVVRRFKAQLPQVELHNLYGPTEAAVEVTAWNCTGPVEGTPDNTPIGKPIANTRMYVLDARMQPMLLGVAGELYIGGVQVARGYLNRAQLSAERFVQDPFDSALNARLYRTGDLARYLPDGNIEYLGRNDDQVKIRGLRIELGEIQARLSTFPAVQEAVVVAREDAPGDKRLVAYYTASQVQDVETLRGHLLEELPGYMVPMAFVHLLALPLSANGKLDRKALPAPDTTAHAQRGYVAVQGELETTLAALWQDILGLERVGRYDHFFELGGHSLLAVRLVSRIRQALGCELGLVDLFATPQLHALAERLGSASSSALPAIEPVAGHDGLALSFAQQRLWFLAQIEGVSATYHLPLGLRLRGRLDIASLQRSLATLFARHAALRSRFEDNAGQPQVHLLPAVHWPALALDRLTDTQTRDTQLADYCAQEVQRPFDLARGPLIRARLLCLAEQEHVLLLTQHHIVSDGWSSGVLLRELSALYGAYQQGLDDPLPPLKVQYPDYAAWQRRWLSGEALSSQVHYWRHRLLGAPELLTLPTDRPRPAQQAFEGASVPVRLGARLTGKLKALSQQQGTTLFMTVVAAWAAVLSRLSGQHSVVIGTPTANRGRSEIEGLLGFFVNTLALHVDLSGQPDVRQLLARVRETAVSAQAHQDLPFEQVVEAINPPRRREHAPLFQAMLAWQNAAQTPLSLPGLEVQPLDVAYPVSKYDVELNLVEEGEEVVGVLVYATALFDAASMTRHLGYLLTMLEAMVQDASQTVERIPLLSTDERRLLLDTWNHTGVPYAQDRCLHTLFEAQAMRAPERIALRHEAHSLTYGELNQRANRLAHHLVRLGVEPGERVAICVQRSLDLMVAVLAVLKAGAAYVPLDPAYPAQRLAFVLQDSDPRLLITHAPARAACALALAQSAPRLLLDLDDEQAWLQAPATDLNRAGVTAQDLAYVIYTSGSTGQPKGVMVEHRQVMRLFTASEGHFAFDETDVWTLFHSFAFDFSVWEIWGALIHGGCLVVVGHATTRSPDAFYALVCEAGVTVLNQTPSAFRQFIAAQDAASAAHRLRYVIFGGEALDMSSLRPWYQVEGNRHTQLVNMYGITETTVHVTYRALTPADALRNGPSPIGERLADLRLYVLDTHGEPVPIGVTGELWVGGAGVARGYLNRPELNAQRFVASRFVAGERLYRSGDLVRYRANGELEYLGRGDFQVKLRGFRIELGEIEAALGAHPAVREAAVLVREDLPGDQRLVAYVVPRQAGSTALAPLLLAHLQGCLPEHMVPAAYVEVPSLPLTHNGKLDRNALAAPDATAYAQRAHEPPQGALETALAGLWQEVLGVERVGRHDNFFALGGHSLLAVQLVARMRRLGLFAEVQALFGETTLAGLAQQTASGQQAGDSVPANRIEATATAITPGMLSLSLLSQAEIDRVVATVEGGAANVQDIYPLAPLQEGVLYHHLHASEGDPYLVGSTLTFASRALLDAFVQALQTVVERHDSLRTGVVWEGLREPVQVVWRHAQLQVGTFDLTLGAGSAAEQLQRHFHPSHYRLTLQRAPLMQAWIAQDESSGRWVMHWLLHHLVDDAASLQLMKQEMSWIMAGQHERLQPPMPYRDYVAQTRQADRQAAHEAYFHGLLGDLDEPTLPYGLDAVQGQEPQPVEARLALPADVCQRLRERARALKASPAAVFHLAWGLVLGSLAGLPDVVFGTVLLGRLQAGADAGRALGMYINTLPLRLRLDATGVAAALQRTHALLAELVEHEQAALVLAQRCSGVRAPLPLFSAILNYRHAAAPQDEGEAQAFVGIDIQEQEGRTNYPLALAVDDLGNGFELMLQATSPIEARRVCGYLHYTLQGLVEALEQAPETALNQIDRLPPDERELLLKTWNHTDTEPLAPTCLHQAFEAQASRTPAATAVIFDEQRLSYAQLDAQANRLARHLRGLGVGVDTCVAVCLEPSLAMVVGLLAVLKAGGAYLPMDPSYPAERLAYLLDDGAPCVLLAHTATRERVAFAPCPVVDLDSDAPGWAALDDSRPEFTDTRAEHLAYVIYTSGSTGQPKGVMVEHRNALNQSHRVARHYGLGQGDRVLQFVSFAFDVAVEDIFASLLCGATVVLRHWLQTDIESFTTACAQQRISALNLPAAFLQSLLRSGRWAAWPSLRRVTIGGEAVDASTLAQWFAQPQAPALFNAYGPTEATVCATLHLFSAGDDPQCIGRPIGNTRLYVLDAHGQPVPLGVSGELWIGGAGVARGYLNREALSAERFVASPFVAGERLYRTGDWVRYRGDGTLEYRGRGDSQVKVRGFRIELGEVEAVMMTHAAVAEAVAQVHEPAPGDKRLVGYVVPRAGAPEGLLDDLRRHLQAHLPAHMVPSGLLSLTALPLTANGKLDRRALPVVHEHAQPLREYQPPQGDTEIRLARIWQEVLQRPRIGRHDDFFEAGGHSLLMIQVAGRACSEGLALSVNDLFTHPNVASLAALLDAPLTARGHEVIGVRKAGTAAPLFLIHEVSGLDAYYARLAQHIDPQVPVYGLPAVPEGQPQLSRIQAMAQRLVGNIRAVQAEGPYRIAGYSFGGVLAYEVAQQLSAAGQAISFLGLIDTCAPEAPERLAPAAAPSDGHYLIDLCRMELERGDGAHDATCAQMLGRLERLREEGGQLPFGEVLEALRAMPVNWQLVGSAAELPLQRIVGRVRAHVEALSHYVADPAPVPVTLFVAQDAGHGDPWLGWEATWCDQQHRRITLPGNHYSIMGEHGASLGVAISQALHGQEPEA